MFRTRTQIKSSIVGISIFITILSLYWISDPQPGYFQRHVFSGYYHQIVTEDITSTPRSNTPGQKALFVILYLLTDMTLESLIILPLGLFGRALVVALVIYTITDRLDLASWSTVVVGFSAIWTSWGYNSTYVHSFSFLYLLFIMGYMIMLRTGVHRRIFSLMLLLYLGIDFFDYTAQVWVLIAGIAFVALLYASNSERSGHQLQALGITTIAAVVYMTKNQFYGLMVGLAGDVLATQSAFGFNSIFGVESRSTGEFGYSPPPETGIQFSLAFYAIVGFCIVSYVCFKAVEIVRERDLELSDREVVIGALMLGGIGGTSLYLLFGRFTGAFVLIGAPLAAVFSSNEITQMFSTLREHRHLVNSLVVILLVVTSGAGFASQFASGDTDPFSETNVEPAGRWITDYTPESSRVLSDLTSIGRMRHSEVRSQHDIDFVSYNITTYSNVVTRGPVDVQYVVVDYGSRNGVSTQGWRKFKSLRDYRGRVDSHPGLNSVYTKDNVTIYSANGQD